MCFSTFFEETKSMILRVSKNALWMKLIQGQFSEQHSIEYCNAIFVERTSTSDIILL
jgi:hypothetical protein